MRPYYKRGSWNAVCDVCGFRYKAEELQKRWDGLMVCAYDFETRQPQDFIRVPQEQISPPWARPESTDQFTPPVCSVDGLTAIPSYAIPGCSIPARIIRSQ